MRDQIKGHALSSGVQDCDVWSGPELEEFLRHDAESLLKRFVEGEAFPDAAPHLVTFAKADAAVSDDDALAIIARLFDRPRFLHAHPPEQSRRFQTGDYRYDSGHWNWDMENQRWPLLVGFPPDSS